VILDLTPIIIPIVVSAVITVGGAFVVRRYAGPAQDAYVKALVGRNTLLAQEREDYVKKVADLTEEVKELREEVASLKAEVSRLTRENYRLLQRLDEKDQRYVHEGRDE
jgi:predicted RNase H-like nuclease (RuvC/YqgF family)